MPPDNVELVIDLEDTSGSVEEEASDSGSSFEVYDRQLLLHLWSSPLIQQSSDTLPIKKLDAWFAELLSDPAHPVPHPNARQHNTRRIRSEEENTRGLQPMGDFRADGARPRRTNDLNASRAGRNGQHTQKEARESNGLPPLRSDAGPWRNSKQAARNTPSSAGLSSQQDETPEWMDDQTENLPGGRSGPSWFGAPGGATDGVDEIQAFKAQMKAMEAKQMRRDNDLPSEPPTPNNSLTDPASLSAQQQQQSQSSSSASHPILDGLMSKASAERTTSNPSLNSAAANANEAPRGSRFAKMFNSNNTSASSTPPNSQGKEEASAAGFMSALLNQGSSSSQGGAPAAPLQSKPEKAQPAASSQDNDMMRIMNMLQSSVSVQQPTQVAPYDHFSQQQQQNVGPQQSRHAFARAQQAPPPRDGPSTSPRQALDLQAMLARSNGGLSPSSGHGARPPTSSASIPDGVAPHSVAGMVNMGKANGPSYAENGYPSKSPNTSLDASRLNIAENGFSAPPPRRSEPPRMQQASYEQMPQAIPPGYPLPRTQPFPTHMQQQQPRQQQQQQHQQGGRQPSLYDLQNMGMFPPGLPGAMHPAARMAMHPQAYGIQQHMMPPPPPPPHQQVSNPAQSLSMMPPAAAQYAQAGGPGRSMGGGGSPDLMALFANAGGVPAQFR